MRLVVIGDTHFRPDRPRCRRDENWIETQRLALAQAIDFANKNECYMVHTGDLFHTPTVPPYITNMVLKEINKLNLKFFLIAGNHDLPYHNVDSINKSSIGTLLSAGLSSKIFNLQDSFHDNIQGFHFGCENSEDVYANILVIHRLILSSASHIPALVDKDLASDIFEEFISSDFILTGDNHKNFHKTKKGKHLINPGTLLRQNASEIDYKTGFYFVDTLKNEVEFLSIDDPSELITDNYLRIEEERNSRIESFVTSVKNSDKVSLDFISNLKKTMEESNIDEEINKILEDLINESSEI